MMVMTAKVNFKKIIAVLAAIAGVVLALILLLGGGGEAETTAAPVSGNDGRVQFLRDFGWEVSTSPTESGQVRIPEARGEVYERYNTLQKSQGYDLSEYAGKTVMRYVYKVNNYPGATEPVYATLLVYKNKIIGGDITDTSARGVIQGFKKQDTSTTPSSVPTAPPAETAPSTETAPSASK